MSRPDHLTRIFLEACALPPAERQAFLDASCAGNAALKSEVEAMLSADDRAEAGEGTAGLAAPVGRAAAGAGRGSSPATLPGRIGSYRILGVLGEGGMGVVYHAEQTHPVRREVALKLTHGGPDSAAVVARFESERQTLALMDHPGIARLFDAGATEDGRPYFVMEKVPGVPITEYCDGAGLDMKARLDLFLKLCHAVRHAHRRGVIHRDLKPSNILVAMEGGEAVPKVIDFSIAKAFQEPLAGDFRTREGQLIGTLEYMSPEQAQGRIEAVDTRSDVYALGVVLYELVTGRRPIEVTGLPLHEAVRRVVEDSPAPVRKGSTLGGPGRVEPDIEAIILKCLEKDADRRYSSAAGLTDDLDRLRASRPILARPPSTAYRAMKFVRRHKVGVGAAAVSVLALVGFSVSMAAQARRVARERALSEEMVRFMTDLFEVSGPDESRGATVTAREILDKGAARIESELAGDPELRASLMHTLGAVYLSLGLHEKAGTLLEHALDLRRRTLGETDRATLETMHVLADLRRRQWRDEESVDLHLKELQASERTVGLEHPDTLRALRFLNVSLLRLRRFEEAERIGQSRLQTLVERHGEEHQATLAVGNLLGNTYLRSGRLAEAERMHLQVLDGRRRILGEDHPDTLLSKRNLANVYEAQGRHGEAQALMGVVVEVERASKGALAPGSLGLTSRLAGTLSAGGRLEEAEKLYLENIDAKTRVLGPEHPRTLIDLEGLGKVYARQGRLDEAERILRDALDKRLRVSGPGHQATLRVEYSLAVVELHRGDRAAALARLGQAVDRGLRDPDPVFGETDLDPGRGDPACEALAARLKAPPPPAPAR